MEDKEKENEENIKFNTMMIEHKAILKMLREQKRIGLISKSEYDYLRTNNLINLANNQN